MPNPLGESLGHAPLPPEGSGRGNPEVISYRKLKSWRIRQMIGQDGPRGPARSAGLPDKSPAASDPEDVEVMHQTTPGTELPLPRRTDHRIEGA